MAPTVLSPSGWPCRKAFTTTFCFSASRIRSRRKLSIADIMLIPSELESFGLAALEAMACEVVPISTRAGGVPEVIDHGKTGYLADVGDVETMARYAIELLQQRATAERNGKAGAGGRHGALLFHQDCEAI